MKKLILKLAEGNPGALAVITELQWYRNWADMLKWMLKTGLTGHKIWGKYKDEYHESWSDFGDWIQKETYKAEQYKKLDYIVTQGVVASCKADDNNWLELQEDFIDWMAMQKTKWVRAERRRIMKAGMKEFNKMFKLTKHNAILQQDFEEIVENRKRL